ncbi:MAG: response regulator [Candidatus Aenigmarchaeota archaeon]|nr:response regulator [Candidatus Aenigmarchaeota archaeon]
MVVSEQPKSALHVEDDKIWQRTIRLCLEKAGYNVVQADNLEGAQTRVKERRFDLYVIDGHFPRIQDSRYPSPDAGAELYQTIIQTYGKNARCVFVSGDMELGMRCRESGVEFFDKGYFDHDSFTSYLKLNVITPRMR